jgi:hypothetical protein
MPRIGEIGVHGPVLVASVVLSVGVPSSFRSPLRRRFTVISNAAPGLWDAPVDFSS